MSKDKKRHEDIISYIKILRESFDGAEIAYKNGSCYKFYEILKHTFPESKPFYTGVHHVVTKINERYYDISGEVFDKENLFIPFNKAKEIDSDLEDIVDCKFNLTSFIFTTTFGLGELDKEKINSKFATVFSLFAKWHRFDIFSLALAFLAAYLIVLFFNAYIISFIVIVFLPYLLNVTFLGRAFFYNMYKYSLVGLPDTKKIRKKYYALYEAEHNE